MALFPLILQASQQCLLIPFKLLVILAIIGDPKEGLLREIGVSICLGV
jgi:hypothetical protein